MKEWGTGPRFEDEHNSTLIVQCGPESKSFRYTVERLPEEVDGAQHLAHGCGSHGYLGRPSKLQLEWAWQIKQERCLHVWSDLEKQLGRKQCSVL